MSAPFSPQNVVLQTGNGQTFLVWDIVVGASSYNIQRGTDGLNFSSVGTSVATGYLDSSVVVGTNYFYRVASVNADGTSPTTDSYPQSITPCLPGQINLGYLRYMSQLRADKLNSQYLTTDEWNFNINQSVTSLYDILVTNYGEDYFFAPPLVIPLVGQDSYALPDGANYSGAPALYKLNGVDVNTANTWVSVARFNWSDRNKYNLWPGTTGVLNGMYDLAYREMGNLLHIIPTNSNQQIRLWYVPILKQMLQDVDMLTFSISGWSEYVINDVAMKAMIKEESLEKWNALNSANQGMILRIETAAKSRDVGQPNTVSNTRATMGDPSFSNGWGGGSGGGYGGGFGG